jgi:putative flippase GtrA
MTCKIIAFEFVVPTAMANALAVMLSIVAVYLTNKYLGSIEQAEAHGLP